MPYIIIAVLFFGGGVYTGKVFFDKPITAGTCLDTGTKSIGEKYDDIMKIIKE